jgi:hypothetical protein
MRQTIEANSLYDRLTASPLLLQVKSLRQSRWETFISPQSDYQVERSEHEKGRPGKSPAALSA